MFKQRVTGDTPQRKKHRIGGEESFFSPPFGALRLPKSWLYDERPDRQVHRGGGQDRRPFYELTFPSFFWKPGLVPRADFLQRDWTTKPEESTIWTKSQDNG